MSSLESPTDADLTDLAFIEEAAGNEDPPTPSRAWPPAWWMIPANLGIFLIWGACPACCSPRRSPRIGRGRQGREPRYRHDDRRVLRAVRAADRGPALRPHALAVRPSRAWIFIGALAGGLALVGLAFANSLVGILILGPSCRPPTTSPRVR